MFRLAAVTCLFLCLHLQSKGQTPDYENTIHILSHKDSTKIYKEHDLIVIHEKDQYVIEFYIKYGKKVKPHHAIVHSDKPFTNASYVWESDNKAAVKLFDKNSDNEFEVKVWGEEQGSGMEVDENKSKKH